MQVIETAIPDVKIFIPDRLADGRGFFSETYNRRRLVEHGIDAIFVQDNLSYSTQKGTIRGLHFQAPPYAQIKLVSAVKGAILDVAVDIRKGSTTFGQYVAVVLSAEEGNQLLVPVGFAHGFCTLEPDTQVFYKVTNYYSPAHDKGVYWADPDIGIDWPVAETEAHLSEKDGRLPPLADLPDYFVYESGGA